MFPIFSDFFPTFVPTIWGSSGDSPGRSPGWAGQDGQGQEGGAGGGGVLTEVRAPTLKKRSLGTNAGQVPVAGKML